MTKRFSIGPFELESVIGRGGMGEVWSGLHVSEGEPVAIKVMTQDGARDDDYLESFENEVRAVAGLSHPHIVTPLDYGEITAEQAAASGGVLVAGSPYIVMEMALRGSLRQYQNAMVWPQVKSTLLIMLDALAHAHAAGIVHRDLKPANILVGCGGQDPGLKLTDFGLARLSESFERSGSQETGWGTPHYMAPEQFRGRWRDYGPWTDLYALGIMAFELVTGVLPFEAKSAMQFAKAHTMDAPRAFEPRFEVPTEMQNWIHRMIQKAPEDRFQCAADAAHALRHLRDTLADAPQGRVIPDAIEPTPVTGRGALVSDTLIERPQTTQIIDPSNTQNHHINFEASSAAIVAGEPLAIRHPPMPVSWRRGVTAPPSMRLLGAGLGLFGLRSVPLVGRDHERDVIWAKLREVRESRKPQVIIIRGGAGTGKSRLAQWMARRAHETGVADVLHAAHSGMGGPTDGLGRMLARHTRCVGLRREEIHDRARQVLQLKPHTREIDPRAFVDFVAPSGIEVALSTGLSTVGTSTDQRFGLLRKFLAVSSAERPFVIVLDDVQWGSEALMFTQYLLERADSQPVPALLVLTVREESLVFRELEDAMIQAVEASPRTTALRLEGLSAAEIDHLVRELLYLDGDLADEIEDRSGGNPLFAVQMVGDLVSRGKLQFGPQGFVLRASEVVEIPDDIHTLWHSRVFRILAHRPSADAIALEIGAALGVEVDREEWALACEVLGIVPPHDLIGVMQAEGLVTRSESGWSFSHGLLRESVQRGSAGAGRWEAVNAACVEMLFRRYPRREYPFHDRMARHLEDANEREAALVHRVAAADDRVERCEFDDAAGHIRVFWNHAQALAVPASDPRRGQAMLIESRMALQQGHLAEALRQAENAAIDARKHKWPMLSLAEVTQAECHLARLEFDKASNMFTRATEEGTGEVLARAVLGLGRVRQGQGRYDEATRQIDGARQQFAALGVHLGQARCLNALGDVMRETKRYREARDYSRDAMRLFEQLGELTGVADCQNDLADLFRLEGQIDKGIEWCLKAIQLYESVGSDESMSARNTLGLLLRDAKRPQEALVVFAQVAQHFSATRNPQGFAVAALHAISCHAMLGDWDEIEAVLQSAREPLRALNVAPYDAGASIGVAFAHASQPRATQVLSPLARLHQEHQRKVW